MFGKIPLFSKDVDRSSIHELSTTKVGLFVLYFGDKAGSSERTDSDNEGGNDLLNETCFTPFVLGQVLV